MFCQITSYNFYIGSVQFLGIKPVIHKSKMGITLAARPVTYFCFTIWPMNALSSIRRSLGHKRVEEQQKRGRFFSRVFQRLLCLCYPARGRGDDGSMKFFLGSQQMACEI